jgi:membrane protease subunit HflK
MTNKTKAAVVSLGIIVGITTVKFIFYFISGSIAVLSEAWHSFSDIATTSLVLISILRQNQKRMNGQGVLVDNTEQPQSKHSGSRMMLAYRRFRAIDTELKIAGVISLFLLSVSSLILWNAIFSEPVTVSNSMLTGIIFIVLSFGSFFLYRFQTSAAAAEGSAALSADSLHNKADMVISLLTGFSLIIYTFGINIDQWTGAFIALFILSMALEMAVNVALSVIKGDSRLSNAHSFSSIVLAFFSPQSYRRAFAFTDTQLGLSERAKQSLLVIPGLLRGLVVWTLRIVVLTIAGAYLATIFYSVGVNQEAFVTRFGRILDRDRTLSPGLHVRMPWPMDKVIAVDTKTIRTLAVGNTSTDVSAMIWSKEHGDNRLFLTGDNNLFLPYLVMHYRIDKPYLYQFSFKPEAADRLLEMIAYRVLNDFFVKNTYYDIALFKRERWLSEAQRRIQLEMDELQTGIEVVSLCLKDLHPPIQVAGAYEDVVAAQQVREQYINNAQKYYNTKIPGERSAALKTILQAESYALQKTKETQGKARNHLLRLEGYRTGGETMRRLLVLKAAEKALQGKRKIVVDPRSGLSGRMIYIEEFISKRKR